MVHDFSNLRENPFFTEILLFLRIGRGAVVDDDDTVALIIRRTVVEIYLLVTIARLPADGGVAMAARAHGRCPGQ